MSLYSETSLAKTVQAEALVDFTTNNVNHNIYFMAYQGAPYAGGDSLPEDLAVAEAATISDIVSPVFFKKIKASGVDTSVQFVIPDASGTISIYSQRYTAIAAANIYANNVRHLYIEVEIPASDILYSGDIRGYALVVDLLDSGGNIATNDSYFAAECDLTLTTGNRLIFLENRQKYTRVATSAGELVRILFAI